MFQPRSIQSSLTLKDKLFSIDYVLVFSVLTLGIVSMFAMYSSSNEPGGTSYRSRLEDKRFTFAGKTGSSQIRKFTEAQREAEVKQEQLKYENRDHALFIAFAPVSDPKYAISVVVEHGGTGSKAAAPIAKKVIKKVLERHSLRKSINNYPEILFNVSTKVYTIILKF